MPVYRLSKARVMACGVNPFQSQLSALAYLSHSVGIPLAYPDSPFGYAKGMAGVWQGYGRGLGRNREGAEWLLPGSWIEVGKRSRSNTETNWDL